MDFSGCGIVVIRGIEASRGRPESAGPEVGTLVFRFGFATLYKPRQHCVLSSSGRVQPKSSEPSLSLVSSEGVGKLF